MFDFVVSVDDFGGYLEVFGFLFVLFIFEWMEDGEWCIIDVLDGVVIDE